MELVDNFTMVGQLPCKLSDSPLLLLMQNYDLRMPHQDVLNLTKHVQLNGFSTVD